LKNLILILFMMIFLTGCEDDKNEWEPNSPSRASFLMDFYGHQDNFEDFKTLFMDGIDEDIIRNNYETIRNNQSERSSVGTITLVKYDNDKIVLVEFKHDTKNQKYLIYNIVEVPEEVSAFFEEELKDKIIITK
jgi:PBP1b-binding outer membrane lipoprotein LpoB